MSAPAGGAADDRALAIASLIQGLEQTERVWNIAAGAVRELDEHQATDNLQLVRMMLELQLKTATEASDGIADALRKLGVDRPFGAHAERDRPARSRLPPDDDRAD